ncbi:carbohydrate binding family 9 domain-containing protein [Pseudoalteromonas sp. Scap03]|uniref:carbohydrate binding family 9 domain-containing protein n=1 Tax=unclassified Pseudoalteromonas TaxID=194690 RepID=UPI0015BF15EE|nr:MULTISPECIES: carbohydrate binding family 9 domain-containing protein [unclassified Pseudoalteromonas]NWL17382.1 carbohydrate binding family 9 domain-containing protein [Pseudoalteromonas sp. Scap03]QLE83422.1 carbohydrate binding family 9 domain-containing protein [Pseudoalteromonas sp. Scap25]QLE91364.1 carbohydrate binding family 9 domain-containing protein [Pseudoalteromonas sp. Scap06]
MQYFIPTKIIKLLLLTSFSFVLTLSPNALADKLNYQLAHINKNIDVDGVLNEPHWQQATRVAVNYQDEPNEKGTPPVKTDAYIYDDGHNLYVAFVAYDTDPSKIRAALRDRDTLWQDDNVGLVIDTFNDERTGYEFYVNPLGAQGDIRMTDTDEWVSDLSWDAIWDSAGTINEQGYVVEMRIPFKALRFAQNQADSTWGFSMMRNYQRDVLYQLSSTGFDRDIKCSLCQFDKITGFNNLAPSKNLQLTPTLTALRNDQKTQVPGEWDNGDVDTEVGLDLRWGITKDAVINATINPDFSQVETDSLELDVNTTYSIYYAEKRPFFLDGASYFKSNLFELLYTRTIAEPNIGAKLTGKTDSHSYALMFADDDNSNVLLPSNQGSGFASLNDKTKAAVARYQYDIGQQGTIGVTTTHRESSDYHNTVLSVDGSYWFNQSDTLNYQIANADTNNSKFLVDNYNLAESQSDMAYALKLTRDKRDYKLYATYDNIGEDYRTDLGYQEKVDYEKVGFGGGQTWYGDEHDMLTTWSYTADWDKSWAQNGDLLEEEYEGYMTFQGQKQSVFELGLLNRYENYNGNFYNQNIGYFYTAFRPTKDLRLSLYVEYASRIDYTNEQLGDVLTTQSQAVWDINNHWQLDVRHNYSHLDDYQGRRVFTANLVDFRLYYKFSMRAMLKLILQFEDIDRNEDAYFYQVSEINKDYGSQLVYSYKINAQTLFYLGYSDKGYQDDSLKSIERDQRTFFTKVSYAWQL